MRCTGTTDILISHIPLYRPPGTPCRGDRVAKRTSLGHHDATEQDRPSDCALTGCRPWRRDPALAAGAGYQYVNMLSADVTAALLYRWQPQLVFSGDDHDDCTYRHPSGAVEVPVLNEPNETARFACSNAQRAIVHSPQPPPLFYPSTAHGAHFQLDAGQSAARVGTTVPAAFFF